MLHLADSNPSLASDPLSLRVTLAVGTGQEDEAGPSGSGDEKHGSGSLPEGGLQAIKRYFGGDISSVISPV